MGVIAFIPVRGGSKSIPLKNIRPFCGKPLVYWNLKALEDTDGIDRIIVSTDSEAIEQTVDGFGLSKVRLFKRSPESATDTASTESAMLDFITRSGNTLSDNDLFMLVQATSPLTASKHFAEAIVKYRLHKYDSMLTCVRCKRFFWNADGTSKNYDFSNRPRRQEFDGEMMENGAFYISTVGNIVASGNRLSGKIGIYEMPEYTSVEIDEENDWLVAEKIFRKYNAPSAPDFSKIKLFLSDVDGVLTDAGMYYSENGDELKKFNTRDGMGFRLLNKQGIKTGIITSEDTQMVERRYKKLQLDYLYQGKIAGGKLSAAREICEKEGIALSETAYIGDDVNCIDLLSNAGIAACPADAVEAVKAVPNIIILNTEGGKGAVREFVEKILGKV
ncbi:MAG: acylneuraminate cytidylyltransferase [Cytophagaceae bacterium]|jgi:N-acylneuraminate cytidylyltransferase|nr:acylneuraminate cytidylyltransferase [Cytophagaceae bacterium]